MNKFSKIFERSFEIFENEIKIENSLRTFKTISDHTCFGHYVKIINRKKIHLQNGDLKLNQLELSKVLKVSVGTVNRILNKMVQLGILLKNIIVNNIVIFSWSETIFQNDSNAIEKAKQLNQTGERITLKDRLKQWIGRKVIDIAKVYERMECKKMHYVETVHYIEDINIKKERKEKEINTTTTYRAREQEVSTDESAVDFDFSYGENEEVVKESVRHSSFSSLAEGFKNQTQEIVAKIQTAFTPQYEKHDKTEQTRLKPEIRIKTLSEKEQKIEEIRFQNEKARLSWKLNTAELLKLTQMEIRKGKDWMKTFLFGTNEMIDPDRIKKQLKQMEI